MRNEPLPILEIEGALVDALRRSNRVVVRAPTGSGKSTQIPRMLLRHGFLQDGGCVVLQPRRIAARMLAARVAWEEGQRPGGLIGHRVRFESCVSRDTRVTFVTEGIVLRQITDDPELRGVSCLVFDEFHERHLYTDITLGCALRLQETTRPDLRIIVMSATLDTVALDRLLQPCVTLESAGRAHPVRIDYLPRPFHPESEPVWEVAAREAARALASLPEGDALVFMPGAYEIQRTIEALSHHLRGGGFRLLPLHGELSPAQQDEAVSEDEGRKVIVATNVAETSLTIPGVRLVVDSGLARIARHDPNRGINTLLVERISRASADQRAGRAGRTAPGVCLRLWTEREHGERKAHELPEIRRMELAEVLLTLKAAGVPSVRDFRWLERPDEKALENGLELLADLGATDGPDGPVTQTGRRMLAFPMHPRYARMLVEADRLGCVRQVLAAAALTQTRSILVRSVDRSVAERRDEMLGGEDTSDFSRQILALHWAERQRFAAEACGKLGIHGQGARQAWSVFQQFVDIARREGLDIDAPAGATDAPLRKCLLAGFADHVARRLDRATLRCALVHGRRATLARESAARDAMLVVAAEIAEIGKGGSVDTLLNLVSVIEEPWLRELFPSACSRKVETTWDPATRRCVSRETVRYHDLVLREIDRDDVDHDQAAGILAARIMDGTIEFPSWEEQAVPWLRRVECLRLAMPELEIPEFTDQDRQLVLEQFCHGAAGARDVRDRELMPWLRDWLPSDVVHRLDTLVPDRIELPGGRKAKVHYDLPTLPKVSSRLQDFYGLDGGLTICAGRVKLRLELLAPNQRPVQVTDNLYTFWRETYPAVRAELSRRYPRHEWR